MNAETFCEQFATFAEAPNGVAKLRELILQLAVQGKLGTQDVNDEPATHLIERIGVERDRAIRERRVKAMKALPPIKFDELTYSVPPNWKCVRLCELVLELQTGPFGSTLHKSDYQIGGTPVINPASLKGGLIEPIDSMAVDDTTVERLSAYKIEAGDILVARRGEMGRCAVVTEREAGWLCGTGSLVMRMPKALYAPFVALLIGSPLAREYLGGNSVGTTMSSLNHSILARMPIALPPLAEQRRIVGKVDQLLGLCDELAARQAARREARSALVGATLDRLVSARSAAEFPAHAHRLRDHFDRLFDTPTTLPQLRQAILQLAVQGQLVPQDPSDEPASELIHRLTKEKAARVRDKKIKEPKLLTPICDNECIPIPETWTWIRMGELIESMTNGLYKHAKFYSDHGTACVRMYNIQDGQLDLCKLKRIDLTDDELQQYQLETTDLIVNRVNSRELVGKAAVVGDHNEPLIFEAMNIRVRFLEKENLPAYANLLLRTDHIRKSFQTDAKQASGQASISQPQVANIAIPLPPLSEQKRIVSKVTELLSLCDALEAKLTQADSASTQLLSAAVHHLLNRGVPNG